MQTLVVALFRKPVLGRRPIGFFQTLVRTLSRWNSSVCKSWEKRILDGGIFSVAPGRSPTDTAWRQTVRGDLAFSRREHVLSLLADLKQCYEH
eukprot:6561399-Pyramimonas_sp.AAC.1